ncbi:MAG: YHYH protein, partial [Actinobacteria bacterium]|nr:YHYH protein [Actinomycetota bacterium]
LLASSGLPRPEARILLEHASGQRREWLMAHGEESLSAQVSEHFKSLVVRRQAGEPIAYLVGWREFRGLALAVNRSVLIPRPETELLVELAIALCPQAAPTLELGTGSGAIALAANGVPIFNALNNRGDDAFLFGELDKWGGHAGRADDYHYHIAPLHLVETVGRDKPIAFALDGFPIYGETEPDGSKVKSLDEFNGHYDSSGAYHYHGTRTYPYINGGLRGVITVAGDQVDPQPTTKPFRPSLEPLRGATITDFSSPAKNSYVLGYSTAGGNGEVAYVVTSTEATFTFTAPDGTVTREKYARR